MTFLTIALNDLRLTVRDKMFFFWFLFFPLLFAVIFGFAFRGSSSENQQIALEIIDRDQSFLSGELIRELATEKYAVNVINETDRTGEEIRILTIPEAFAQKVLNGEKAELVLERKSGSDIQASQAAYSHLLKAVIKILAEVVHANAENENELKLKLSRERIERLVTLRAESAGAYKQEPSGFNHSIPAISVMFILFTLFMYGGILLLEERRSGQLERLSLSPVSFPSIIGGKWLSRLLLGLAQIFVLFLVGKIVFKNHYGSSLIGIILIALGFTATAAGISLFLGSVFRKEEVLVVFNILLANTMSGLGGCWFPLEFMPPAMKTVSMIFPTGWTMDAFNRLIFLGAGLKSVLVHLIVLSLFTILFLILAVRFFKVSRI